MASISTYIPMSERSIWSDIQPIEQQDGPSPLVPIMYSEEYRDAMNYFRAVTAVNEQSERALELTETIIRLNPSHYTVWQYRMEILLALNKDLNAELELMNEFAEENLKSYQVWHHRLTLMQTLNPTHPSNEIKFIHQALLPDPKNYHTWAYLHWLYSFFTPKLSAEDWVDELKWCESMIEDDARNNSAWAWRWFLRCARDGAKTRKEGGDEELSFVIAQISKVPHNVSAWNYLRGLVREFSLDTSAILVKVKQYTARPSDPNPCGPQDVNEVDAGKIDLPVSYALEFLAENKAIEGHVKEAAEIYQELETDYDPMRAGYWAHRRAEVLKPKQKA